MKGHGQEQMILTELKLAFYSDLVTESSLVNLELETWIYISQTLAFSGDTMSSQQ